MLFCYSGMSGQAVLWPSLPDRVIKKRENCHSTFGPLVLTFCEPSPNFQPWMQHIKMGGFAGEVYFMIFFFFCFFFDLMYCI